MATVPFTVSVTVTLPSDDGQDQAPIQYNFSGSAGSMVEYKLELSGSGTKTLDFGTSSPTGAKFVLVKVAAGQGVGPVLVHTNGAVSTEEVSAGGMKMLCSPSPIDGITSMSLEYTTAASVRVWVLG